MINKRNISIIYLFVLFVACSGEGNKINDKQSELEKLKSRQQKLQERIQKLEKSIGNNNSANIKRKIINVSVSDLKPQKFESYIEVQGRIYADQNVNVSSRSSGTVTRILVKEGQNVNRGQILALIDSQTLKASIEELKSSLTLADAVYVRQKNLWDQKIGTELQYLQAKNNKENLERKLATMHEQLDMYSIKAPISGTIDAVIIKIGEMVNPGMAAFRLVNMNNLKVKAEVSEIYVDKLKKGMPVFVNFPTISKQIKSAVSHVGRAIDQTGRTVEVEVTLRGNSEYRPNMIAALKIIDYSADNSVVIPVNLVQTQNEQSYVYVATEKENVKTAERKDVKVGKINNSQAEITQGLEFGDKIITSGYKGITEGDLLNYSTLKL